MTKIGIEITPMLVEFQTGIEQYVSALVQELAGYENRIDDIRLVYYLHTGNPFSSKSQVRKVLSLLDDSDADYRVYFNKRGYGLALSYYTRREKLDLIHMPRCDRPRRGVCPYIVTFHDINQVALEHEERAIERSNFTSYHKSTLDAASGIIFVSESTKKDLIEKHGYQITAPYKIIHHGVGRHFFSNNQLNSSVIKIKIPTPYILFVGSIQFRKNLARLVEAFGMLKETRRIPHKLVLVGRNSWGAELVFEKINELSLQHDVIFTGYVADNDLPQIYAGADVFAYTSLHEGFGIPILEAFASETVVITSQVYSMPEVAGDAAIYVDPRDAGSIATGLWRAISDQELRKQLRERGVQRARQFTWQKSAQSTIDFYKEVVDNINQDSGNRQF